METNLSNRLSNKKLKKGWGDYFWTMYSGQWIVRNDFTRLQDATLNALKASGCRAGPKFRIRDCLQGLGDRSQVRGLRHTSPIDTVTLLSFSRGSCQASDTAWRIVYTKERCSELINCKINPFTHIWNCNAFRSFRRVTLTLLLF